MKAHYLRLAVWERDEDSGRPLGVFQAAYALRDDPDVDDADADQLRIVLRWFGLNLTSPRNVHPRAIFWFKLDAREHFSQLWCIVRVLRTYGRDVRMFTCRDPGRIIYQDDAQVAAIPESASIGVVSRA